jgi:hypothetical protein
MALYITYDNQELTDGLGAQALRIIGIYSIAQKYRIKYIHSPIIETIEEFAHGITNERDLLALINRANEFFHLPSVIHYPTFDLEFRIRNLNLRLLARMLLRYKFSPKSVLLRVCLPFGITDRNPEIYEHAIGDLRVRNSQLFHDCKENEIVLHFRMGYGQKTQVAPHVKPRFLPLEYYLSAIKVIAKNGLDQGIRNLVIHTDLSNKEVLWTPSAKRLRQNISFGEDIVDGKILVPKSDVYEMFKSVEGMIVNVKYGADLLETFIDMANAGVLIMSRSAFSYLAALFNKNLVIYPSNHGHSPLNSWIKSDSVGISMHYKLIPG